MTNLPTRRHVHTAALLGSLALVLGCAVSLVPWPPAYTWSTPSGLLDVLTHSWVVLRLLGLQRTLHHRWHVTHNTPLGLSPQEVERLYG